MAGRSKKVAVITGAGSGVGQAVAVALGRRGWALALLGRTESTLKETARQAKGSARCRCFPCNIGDQAQVAEVAEQIIEHLGSPDVLVNSAGTNIPRRSLADLSLHDYHVLVATNLHGAFYCVQAFLPIMRRRRSGTIINVVSDAGKLASPKAGPGYVVSKFGLAGLTQSINAEERQHGIRACAVFPGDIDTPLLEKRPQPPDATARKRMLKAEDVAATILMAIELPPRAIIEELVIRPA